MSHVRHRTKWGQKQSELPSPFLEELDRTYIEELDYSKHMKEQVPVEETGNFFAGLKAMLAEE
jgi:DNA helicase-2/ATP-dependent DNA helicase PcrA